MKTKLFLMSFAIAMVLSSTVLFAGEKMNSSNAVNVSVTQKIENIISQKIDLTRDMNETTARIEFRVDKQGNVSFTRVNYYDESRAREIMNSVANSNINTSALDEGLYFVKIKFIVR